MYFPHKVIVRYENGKPIYYKEGNCDSTETKPTKANTPVGGFFDISDGSFVVESDTGDVYFYNENADSWGKMFTFKET